MASAQVSDLGLSRLRFLPRVIFKHRTFVVLVGAILLASLV
jgi:hypothetical protein